MEASHHYVNTIDVVNRNLPDSLTGQNVIIANNELLQSLQQDKQVEQQNLKNDATGNEILASIKNPTKSKSLSHLMTHAFSKKFTIKETRSFVGHTNPPTTSNEPNSSGTSTNTVKLPPTKKKIGNMMNDKKAKYAVFRNPTVILRDVKNCVAQRFKSKQNGSLEFEKFENEVSTPASAKLYSPFGVFTDSIKTQVNCRLDSLPAENDLSLTPKSKLSPSKKNRLRHLKQKLVFDSPTGKLRESVDDVEKFQKDIHKINAHICASQQQSSTIINFQLHEPN